MKASGTHVSPHQYILQHSNMHCSPNKCTAQAQQTYAGSTGKCANARMRTDSNFTLSCSCCGVKHDREGYVGSTHPRLERAATSSLRLQNDSQRNVWTCVHRCLTEDELRRERTQQRKGYMLPLYSLQGPMQAPGYTHKAAQSRCRGVLYQTANKRFT